MVQTSSSPKLRASAPPREIKPDPEDTSGKFLGTAPENFGDSPRKLLGTTFGDSPQKFPSEVLSVGDVVQVKVLTVDEKKKRIGLSIKQAKG